MAVRLKQLNKDFCVDLSVGTTVLGRGPLLKCADKKISRNHAEIEVLQDGRVFFKSLHVNPCFYKEGGDGSLQITIPQNKKQELQKGDVISLLADAFEYEVNILVDVSNENKDHTVAKNTTGDNQVDTSDTGSKNTKQTKHSEELLSVAGPSTSKTLSKRKLPEWLIQAAKKSEKEDTSTSNSSNISPAKKKGKGNSVEENISPKPVKANTTKNTTATAAKNQMRTISENDSDSEGESKVKKLPAKADAPKNKNSVVPNKQKQTVSESDGDSEGEGTVKKLEEEDVVTDVNSNIKGNVSTKEPDDKPVRKPCEFGKTCYRKNPIHFRECSHPGDPDYKEAEEDDDRPECEYGSLCYRKNPLHRRDFKHTAKLPKRKAAQKAKAAYKDDDDEEGEYESSFIDDDTDEYNPDSSEPESEDLSELMSDAQKIIKKS